ncbi:hypothetical protein BGZ99_007872 [Dissophora globulifera]|uniref:DUF676 domain-containing protein n=1 Tax=Dissophora globulifera TaxID=979702 RepID=A0A9P6R8L1_9FUNG|nr:hypothetical protein BGZ99_007872 [Dissophora globulifera]
MTQKPFLALQHKVSLSVGGIVRYRIKVLPSHIHLLSSLQFHVRNSSPIYRNITPSSGPWKISLALIRNPDKTPALPRLVPSIGCAQVSRLDANVIQESDNSSSVNDDDNDDGAYVPGCNEWELEVLSEMVLQPNWIDIKVEVYIVPQEDVSVTEFGDALTVEESNASGTSAGDGTFVGTRPQILLPSTLSCEYKDTATICGPTYPDRNQSEGSDGAIDGLHLVVLTHGIHGTWLDMLYIKEQIDESNRHGGNTVTLLTDTNHAGTEEGIQMAGQRVALDILELTGYNETEHGRKLFRSLSTVIRKKSLSKDESSPSASAATSSTTRNDGATAAFPRGFSKVSVVGHSLGGLINIYALGYIEDLTKGAFFQAIKPTHFITLATPLLGIGFEHPWILGYALSLGVIGQTGKDLALEQRSSKLKRSSSALSRSSMSSSISSASSSSSKRKFKKDKKLTAVAHTTSLSSSSTSDRSPKSPPECVLDEDPAPLLLAMARSGSVSNRVLRQFKDRTAYANIENDMAVRYKTSSMMGIPTFDMDQFFSPEGAATQPRKSLYHSALTSVMALLFPKVPTRAKFLSLAELPSPIVVVDHGPPAQVQEVQDQGQERAESQEQEQGKTVDIQRSNEGVTESTARSRDSGVSQSSSRSSSLSSRSSLKTKASASESLSSKSRLEIAHLVAEGYAEMDWTRIGVFIEYEAHVQIIVRRKWYNVDGWKCVQDLVARFDFT